MEAFGLIEIKNDLSEEKLLHTNRMKGEILGKRLNIKDENTGKWVPRNKLHRVMAAHENYFKQFFTLHMIKNLRLQINTRRNVEKYYGNKIKRKTNLAKKGLNRLIAILLNLIFTATFVKFKKKKKSFQTLQLQHSVT